MGRPHDVPDMVQLVEAVREWVEGDLMDATEGRVRFHARVAANMLAMVEREIALGADHARAHDARLATLGVTSDAQLAAAIRDGDLDDRLDEVRAVLRSVVDDKLAVANPRYLDA